MMLKGRAWKYGDNVDTDVIIPARYLNVSTAKELAAHCMEDIDPDFAASVKDGDIIVAGENFGCGSSREHAPLAIKGSGVSCIIASSYARIFYRNAINIGVPILESPDAVRDAQFGHEIEVQIEEGMIRNLTLGKTYRTTPYPRFMLEIIGAGGLVPYTVARIERRRRV